MSLQTPHAEMKAPGPRLGMATLVIILVVSGLAAADRFLARVESSEVRSAARESYLKGTQLLNSGKAAEAVDYLRDAHAAERENPQYELQLVTALTESGKASDSQTLLDEILAKYPNDGRANLLEARIKKDQGDISAAEAFYHRAIFGEWQEDAADHRTAAQMELIGMLAATTQKQELLAELISLDTQASSDLSIQRQLAPLFLAAGSPERAASIYQELIAKDPNDGAAYEGLGQVELEEGQYRAAHNTFQQVYLKNPNDPSVRAHLEILDTVMELDPTLRQLTSAEKYDRSIRILDLARMALNQCVSTAPPGKAPSYENEQLLRDAQAVLSAKRPAYASNEIAEGVLSLAEKLWRAEVSTCGSNGPEKNALDLIMSKLVS